MSKRTSGVLVLLAIAALDFAALDDITTGNQPNFTAEWTALVLSVPLAWLVIRWLRRSGHPDT